MKTYTAEELKNILELHHKYLLGEKDGVRADLCCADLCCADLSYANLHGADLSYANLRSASLFGANLSYANLLGANLSYAILSGANITNAILPPPIVPEFGQFYGYKKLDNGYIALLLIPKSAARVGGLLGRKCRASKAKVKAIFEPDGVTIADASKSYFSRHDADFVYKVGTWVKPKEAFNADVREACTSGIHFFLTLDEAKKYDNYYPLAWVEKNV
jgi:hypothetical protein